MEIIWVSILVLLMNPKKGRRKEPWGFCNEYLFAFVWKFRSINCNECRILVPQFLLQQTFNNKSKQNAFENGTVLCKDPLEVSARAYIFIQNA